MNKIVIDVRTGSQQVVALTPEEEADAVARTAAEEAVAAPIRKQAADDVIAANSAKSDNVIQYLVTHTPAECAQYVQDNVTDLASAKAFLKKVAMALSVLARRELR